MNGRPNSKTRYRFTFGPWNISTGADPFGPAVRKEVAFAAKIREYKKLGFDGVQFHDDDVVEADLDHAATLKGAAKVQKMLDGEGLFCEFIAPRLWEHPKTIDGGYTSNNAAERRYAIERSKRAIDIANALGLQEHRPVAGPRRDLHPRGQGSDRLGRSYRRCRQRSCSDYDRTSASSAK